jgi:hypothetical protein
MGAVNSPHEGARSALASAGTPKRALTRQLLAALLLAGSAVAVTGAPAAAACPTPTGGLAEHAKVAADVFSGAVAGRSESGSIVTYTITVDRVYKGSVSTEQVSVTTDTRPRACGLPTLPQGTEYVFFAQESGGELTTGRRTGTAPATPEYIARVEGMLGAGRPAVTPPPPPAEVTFTTVAEESDELQRVAAPGVALILAGLLGLVLVAAVGRRRT